MTEPVDVAPAAGSETQAGLLLAMLDDGTRKWREEMGEVSSAALTWQPFPQGHSIGTLLLHIADVEAYWLQEVGQGLTQSPEELATLLSEETRPYQFSWPTPPAHPLSWFLARHDEVRARTREIVSGWDDPAFACPAQGKTFTRRWLLHLVLTDEAYHGGQAVLLSILHARR